MRLSAARSFFFCCWLACLSAVSACGRQPGEIELWRATGELFCQGQPAVGARLAFHPQHQGSPDQWPSGYPRAVVDQSGKFVVETHEPRDGCPAGEYIILVTWPAILPGSANSEEAETVDRLRGRYATCELSPLKAEVEPKATELGRYEVK